MAQAFGRPQTPEGRHNRLLLNVAAGVAQNVDRTRAEQLLQEFGLPEFVTVPELFGGASGLATHVIGSHGGQFVVDRGGDVYERYENDYWHWCLYVRDPYLTAEDRILAKLLLLRSDENFFRSVARGGPPPYRNAVVQGPMGAGAYWVQARPPQPQPVGAWGPPIQP